jgi:transcriptional antiterminator RfaH
MIDDLSNSFSEPTIADGDDRWWVLHTRSRQEKAVADALRAGGVHHFLPLIEKVRFHGRRKLKSHLPLFPGYVFLFGLRDAAFEVDRNKRIANILPVVDQQQMQLELENLRKALDLQAPLDPYPYLKEGIWAEVRSGPFQGVQGKIERRMQTDRLLLQVDMLGRAVSIEIDGSLLEPIDDPIPQTVPLMWKEQV